ncbi:ImpA family metalloprotease [Gallaecimonas kandeliae]|uniref:ImpA family metalloprotease n=1 Tax=Gallaecimonas kandeliae TaxID=3029055 RepID=UPI0026470C22|nr:ImpA family metalloprotease [Gallaecimonas kandeliae]WKE65518.1 ImpA family metalloprotease [Gallaecimonas kandeliae]
MKKLLFLGSLLLAGCGGGGGGDAAPAKDQAPNSNQAPTASALALTYDWASQSASGNWQSQASDADGDTLTASVSQQGSLGSFSLAGDQLSYTANAGTQGDDQGTLTISDGHGGSTAMTVTVSGVDGRDGVTRALAAGDASYTDSASLLARIQATITGIQGQQSTLAGTVFAADAIDYAPGQNTQIFNISAPDSSFPLLEASTGQVLALAGSQGGGRYAAFGTPLLARLDGGDFPALVPATQRLLGWLLNADPAQAHSVALAFLGGYETASRNWLQAQFPQWTIKSCNDVATLADCLAGSELVVSGMQAADGDATTVVAALKASLAKGVPLLYQHWSWGSNALSDGTAALLGASLPYAGNWFANASATWSDAQAMLDAAPWLKAEQTLVQHLVDQDFSFDWSACTSSVGTTSCDQVAGLHSAFLDGARALRAGLNQLDRQGLDLFNQDSLTLSKLFVLLGDSYRQGIHYPMDKASTNINSFMAAYLADHLAYYHHSHNPAQPDLGNFSDTLPANLPLVNQTLNFTLGADSEFRGTGLYLLPGQSISVLRTDGQAVSLGLFINTQRTGSTREFNTNGYLRPKFLQSPTFDLKQGQGQTITSPYGGPLMVQLPAGSGQLSLQISGATPYPYLTDFSKAADFLAQLNDTALNWSGIRTDFVEINSRRHMMQDFINSSRYQGNAQQALDDVWTYMIKGTYDLAGYQGEGLALPAAVQARCTSLGWDCTDPVIHAKPKLQHINIDESANCGAGCSGNPYDQAWTLDPFGWGESHEIGHNNQPALLRIYGGRSSETSNNIFPLHKGWQRFMDSGERIDSCDRQSPATTYLWLQDAHNQADPTQAMYDKLWSQTGIYDNAGQRLDFYLQLAFLAEDVGGLDNGWELYTLLYLEQRLFNHASQDAATWTAQKDALGMGSFATAPSLDGNDFMVMAGSYLLKRDLRPLFDAWGIRYSSGAASQVAAYGYPAAALVFYKADSQCMDMKGAAKLPIDGSTAWPAS